MLTGLREAKRAMAQGKDPYSPICVPRRGPAVEKIEAALDSPAELAFKNTPLTGMVAFLKDRYKVEVQLDKKAMDEAGIGADVTVSKNVKGISLRSALRSMLQELKLTCLVQDEVLLITTTEAAENRMSTTIYPVADLVERYRDEKGAVWTESEPLIDKIQSTVQPKTWSGEGGPGSICHCPNRARPGCS